MKSPASELQVADETPQDCKIGHLTVIREESHLGKVKINGSDLYRDLSWHSKRFTETAIHSQHSHTGGGKLQCSRSSVHHQTFFRFHTHSKSTRGCHKSALQKFWMFYESLLVHRWQNSVFICSFVLFLNFEYCREKQTFFLLLTFFFARLLSALLRVFSSSSKPSSLGSASCPK